MTLEQQLTSKDISKCLQELGVKQESLFFYAKSPANKFRLYPLFFDPKESKEVKLSDKEKEFSAFTVAELGEMLPGRKEENGIIIYFTSHKNIDGSWTAKVAKTEYPGKKQSHIWAEVEFTEADARGKMLIYLLENKLITL